MISAVALAPLYARSPPSTSTRSNAFYVSPPCLILFCRTGPSRPPLLHVPAVRPSFNVRMEEEPEPVVEEAEEAPAPPPPAPIATATTTALDVPGRLKDAAEFNRIWKEGLNNIGLAEGDSLNFWPEAAGWATTTEPKNKADMVELAKKLNPAVGFWDPLQIVTENTQPETIGWFRQAEIKHGRVAMAGFVGFLVQSNGISFPWNIQGPFPGFATSDLPAVGFSDISAAGGPADQWDALPTAAKVQILCVVGFLEMWSENSAVLEADGQKHYVRGGKPGYFPSFKGRIPHPVPLDLWDPFGFTKKLTPEQKETKLLAEVNNGRLAMIGMMGVLSASKGLIVPGLNSLPIPSYSGEIMAPFTAADGELLPFVSSMASSGTYLMDVSGGLGF